MESETYTVDSFDISPIRYKYGFTYDEFSKSWKYLYKHDKVFSDALESVWIVVYSEDYGTNIAEVDIRASLTWRDAANSYMTVKGVEILIGDDVYHVDMIESPNERYSYSVLYNETSYNLIEAISKAYSLKIKVIYDNTSDIIELWTNPFRNLCGDIVRYNMWDYYIPNDYLSTLDTTTVR